MMTETDERWIVDRRELAVVFGLATVSIDKMCVRGMPKEARGKYHVPTCVQWYVDRWRNAGKEADPTDVRSRLTLAQASKYELDTEILRGRHVPIALVERVVAEAVAMLAASMDGLGARLAGVLADETDPAAVAARIVEETRQIRERYAHALGRCADASVAEEAGDDLEASGRDSDAAEDADGRPVGRRVQDPATGEPGAGAVA